MDLACRVVADYVQWTCELLNIVATKGRIEGPIEDLREMYSSDNYYVTDPTTKEGLEARTADDIFIAGVQFDPFVYFSVSYPDIESQSRIYAYSVVPEASYTVVQDMVSRLDMAPVPAEILKVAQGSMTLMTGAAHAYGLLKDVSSRVGTPLNHVYGSYHYNHVLKLAGIPEDERHRQVSERFAIAFELKINGVEC